MIDTVTIVNWAILSFIFGLMFLAFLPNIRWLLLSFVLFISNVMPPSVESPLILMGPLEALRDKSRLLCLIAVFLLLFLHKKKNSWIGIKPPIALVVLITLQLFLLGVDFFRLSFINENDIFQRAFINLLFLTAIGMKIPSWINNFDDVKWFFRSVVGGTFLFIIVTCVQLLSDPTQVVWNGRLYAVSAHPNFAAVMFSMPVPICLWLSQVSIKKMEKYFWIVLMMMCAVGLIWTGSRTGLLMTLVGVGVYMLSSKRSLIPIVVVFPFFSVSIFLPKFTYSLNRLLNGQNTRLEAWSSLWSQFIHNPIFGMPTNEIQSSENSYLWIALRGGIVGLGLLLLVWFLISRNLKDIMAHQKPFLKNAERLLLACFCSYFIGSFFEGYINMTIGYQILIFYCLITVLSRLSRVTA